MSEAKEVPINSEKFTSSLFISTLKLFRALPTKTQKKRTPSTDLIKSTINNGFVFSPQTCGNYTDAELENFISLISTEVGITPAQMNSSFHKSWGKVRDAPMEQLVFEQLAHYMTTYGYERLGTYLESTVFIPNEQLDVPALKDGVKLAIIKGYTKSQLKEKLLKLINSGIALDDITEIVEIAQWVGVTDNEVLSMKNKEIRVKLYSHLDLVPADPVELLRLAVYETTDRTLLIVNKGTIELIKTSDNSKEMSKLFTQYDEDFGFKHLARVYNRFKPLFLAFKPLVGMSPIVNKISHLSNKYHKPMRPDMLNNITAMLKKGEPVYPSKLDAELDRVNIWRKIRLAQSLGYRMSGNKSIMYKIRNGKAFATELNFDATEDARKVYDIIITSIAKDLKHLKGKEFYIPENLTYALPATAKQFSGNMPTGSYVTVGKDMIFGVWWENQTVDPKAPRNDDYYERNGDTHGGKRRIDLDLHGLALNAGHVGWNAQVRSGNRSLMFTGDVVDAPKGATELFYINKDYEDTVLLTLNYFNFDKNLPVPFKFMVAEEHPNTFGKNYTIDPNNLKTVIKTQIDVKQKTIGLATVKDGECRFYFSESGLGDTNAVKGGKYVNIARDYMANYFKNQITFNEVIEKVGAKIVTTATKNSIDLSPENLEKDTFINLLIK